MQVVAEPLHPNITKIKRIAVVRRGFTLVELLIVIVVIAILAAITIVAYNGIQQRANNTSIIAAAKNSLSVIDAYIAANDAYPLPTTDNSCVTSASGCVVNTTEIYASATFDTNLASLGTLPRSIPMTGGNQTGILYSYKSGRTYNGAAQPAILYYWLYGTSQPCGLSDVVTGWVAGVSSSTGYTFANDSSTGKTLCYIHISGPSS